MIEKEKKKRKSLSSLFFANSHRPLSELTEKQKKERIQRRLKEKERRAMRWLAGD